MTTESIPLGNNDFQYSPRFSAEASNGSPPSPQLKICWDDQELLATAWHIEGPLLYLGVLPTESLPPGGTAVVIRSSLGGQQVKLRGTVRRYSQIYGTTFLIECSLRSSRQPDPVPQRRANRRFRVGNLSPAFCFATNPITGKVISFVVADVSSGGLALHTPTSPWLLPGLRLRCRIDAAGAGTFETHLLVGATEKLETNNYRVSAEFESLKPHVRETLAASLTSATTQNSIGELKRERLLSRAWPDLLRLDSRSLSNDGLAQRVQISGKLADTVVCSCVMDIQADGSVSTSRYYLSPLLDTFPLENWLEQRVHEHRDLLRPQRLPSARSTNLLMSKPGLVRHPSTHRRQRELGSSVVQWDEYAEAYDTMCNVNPAYQENISIFRDWISELELPENAKICDLGAGTGNYVIEAAIAHPTAHVLHVDSDPVMNRTARRKYKAAGTSNVSFLAANVLNAGVGAATIDLIVCVNALYVFPSVRSVLAKCHDWMKPGAYFFLIDLGRPMDVRDWSEYLISSNVKSRGLTATVGAFIRGRKAIGQNRLIRRQQDRGAYWLHTHEQLLAELEAAGFAVVRSETCYRGVCDLAICSKH